MLKDLINEYREIMLDPVIDVMKEETTCTNDLDKKKETQHKIDALISAWYETQQEMCLTVRRRMIERNAL